MYEKYYNGETDLYACKYDYEILKTVIEITKIPRTLKKVQKQPSFRCSYK